MSDAVEMGSSRPYLLRAIHAWIVDNGCTPFLLVDAGVAGVDVPAQAVTDGRVVLNLDPQAVASLEMGNADIVFLARFGGVSKRVCVPVTAVRALYAQETGQGMAFADEEPAAAPAAGAPASAGPESVAKGADDHADEKSTGKPVPGASHLRIIK